MRHKFFLLSFLVGAMSLNSCDPTPIVIDASTYISLSITIDIGVVPDTQSGKLITKNATSNNYRMIFYGTVLDKETNSPQSAVEVRIVGTDTPGGMINTNETGYWQMELPIVPYLNNENYTMFVIEARQSGIDIDAEPISKYSNLEHFHEICELLGVTDPNTYMVSGLSIYYVEWENLYNRTECPIFVKKVRK